MQSTEGDAQPGAAARDRGIADAGNEKSGFTQVRDLAWARANTPADARATWTDVTSAYATLSVMGPNARDLLQALTPSDLSDAALPFGTSRMIEIGYALVRALKDYPNMNRHYALVDGKAQLVTPDRVRRGRATLEEAVLELGWPRLGVLRLLSEQP